MNNSAKLAKIREENARMEKDSPYNFCDRWCERCPVKTQIRCSLYLDEVEHQAVCAAYGREPDDPQITEEILKQQYAAPDEGAWEEFEDFEIDLDEAEGPEWEKIKEHIKFVQNNPLPLTGKQYHMKAFQFLGRTFFGKKPGQEFTRYFEEVAWYHTLLPVKLQRALAGFHEPACEEEFALYDAVAQFDICQKAVKGSIEALRFLQPHYPEEESAIRELLALLHNLSDRIKILEESI